METLIQTLIALGLLVVVVLLVLLIDRISAVEKETRKVARTLAEREANARRPFFGLNGKVLWDAMTSGPPPGVDAESWLNQRERYKRVLYKHIESLFMEGVRDGRAGVTGEPHNPRSIQSSRGTVESWLPPLQVGMLYQCGIDMVQKSGDEIAALREQVDRICRTLHEKVGLEVDLAYSNLLIPQLPGESQFRAAAPAAEAPLPLHPPAPKPPAGNSTLLLF